MSNYDETEGDGRFWSPARHHNKQQQNNNGNSEQKKGNKKTGANRRAEDEEQFSMSTADLQASSTVSSADESPAKCNVFDAPELKTRDTVPETCGVATSRCGADQVVVNAGVMDGEKNTLPPVMSSPTRSTYSIFKSATHAEEVSRKIEKYYSSEQLTDVTVVDGEGRRVGRYHRLVLAAASDYFAAMFTGGLQEERLAEVRVGDVDSAALQTLIHYCYTGEVRVETTNVEVVLAGARLLQLTEVVDACADYLATLLHAANCLGVRAFADAHGCPALHHAAHHHLLNHFAQVIEHQEYTLLSIKEVTQLLQSDELNIYNETEVFQAVLLWIQHDEENRRRFAAELLSVVRLPLLMPQFLTDHVENHRWFKDAICQQMVMDALKYKLMPERRTSMPVCRPRKATVGSLLCIGGMDANRGAITMELYDNVRDAWRQLPFGPSQLESVASRLQFGCCVVDGVWLYVAGGRDGLKTLASVERWRHDDDHASTSYIRTPPCQGGDETPTSHIPTPRHDGDEASTLWSSTSSPSPSRRHAGVPASPKLTSLHDGDTATTSYVLPSRHRGETSMSHKSTARHGRDDKSTSWLPLLSPRRRDHLPAQSTTWRPAPSTQTSRYDEDEVSPRPRDEPPTSYKPTRRDGCDDVSTVWLSKSSPIASRRHGSEPASSSASAWRPVPPMPTPRHGLGVAVVGDQVYACGGHDGWAYLATVERYNPAAKEDGRGGGAWTRVADMNHARSTAGFAVLDDKLYAVGGRDSSQVLRSVERYNPHTNKWTLVASMNKQRSNFGVGVLNGYLYAVGGIDAPASNPSLIRFSCVERYDARSDTWTFVAPLTSDGGGRDGVAVATLGHRLFAVGGYNGAAYVDTVQCYDDRDDAWTTVSSLGTGRAGSGLVVLSDRRRSPTVSSTSPATHRPANHVYSAPKVSRYTVAVGTSTVVAADSRLHRKRNENDGGGSVSSF